MADDLKERGQRDRSRINVNELHEVKYWSKKLGVTETELKKVVEQVGPMAAAVERRLGK